MTEQTTIALIAASAGLVGALIGGLASALGTYIQARAESRRQLVRLATEIELEQLKTVVDAAVRGTSMSIGDSSGAIVSFYKLLDALTKYGPDDARVKALVPGSDGKPK
jgi:hypothetical protein